MGAMIKWMCDAVQPYSTISNQQFQEFIKVLQPKFSMPSEKTIRVKYIPRLYNQVQFFVKCTINEGLESYSITTDAWTSSSQESYLSVTIHYISKDLERKMAVLRAVPFNVSHTSEAILEQISSILQDWGLPAPAAAVRDSASNMVKALKDMNGVPCYIHTLQLVIKHSVLKQKQLATTIKKSRAIVKKLRTPLGKWK